MPQGQHYMEKSFEVVKTGNDKGKFKLEINKVIKCVKLVRQQMIY